MARPRAADDFAAIRARLLQLQRERAQVLRREPDEARAKPYNQPAGRGQAETEGQEEFRPFRRFTR
jgi:hypothetical protein